MMASPAIAQSNAETVVRFTGFLGDLRFSAEQLRAELDNATDDTAQVAIALDEDASAAFALFTRTHLNQPVTMFVCGETAAAPTITAEITSGFAITDPIERDRAAEIVDALNGLQPCPE
ncbi:SecDF P1 head subdomain-containing protein [Yoonia litorea]|nr:hypothetical protein [Yoonia litorea]